MLIRSCINSTGVCVWWIVRPGGVSKIDMSDDSEHTLSKVDVVLTFAVEVGTSCAVIY